ncbi:MAG: hypothetical protein K5776_09165 [Lachnospiraceae bacterium]|nr:hypothetical protein [Lachnospiraceae bacterium]
MKNSMSNSDKRLLLIMFLFVVIVGIGYWGVYPQIKNFIKLEKKIENEEVKRSINDQKVSNLLLVEAQCDEYEEKMAKNKERFYDRLSEADIDLMLTSKAIRNQLEAFNLDIQISDLPSERMAYKYAALYNEQAEYKEKIKQDAEEELNSTEKDIEELTSGKKKKKGKEEDEEEVIEDENVDLWGDTETVGLNNDIYAANVMMTLGGDREDLEAFLKEIMESDKEILITSFSWSKYRTQVLKDGAVTVEENPEYNASDLYEVVEMDSLTIAMEIYMCDKDVETTETEE